MDVVIERLKEEAAKHGANGILFQGTVNEYGTSTVNTTGTTITSNADFVLVLVGLMSSLENLATA